MVAPWKSALLAVALSTSSPSWAEGLPEVAGSPVGYPTPAEALAALRARPNVQFSDFHGWTIATDMGSQTIWSFTPADHPTAPAVVKRQVVQIGKQVGVRTSVLCGASKAACDALVIDFAALLKQQFPSIR